MGSHWLALLVGLTIIQGLLALSPIPVPEDEWESFSRTLRDPAYRLPTTSIPRHYEVSITPYFAEVPNNVDPFTFDGVITVYLSPTEENVNEIVMHCDDLTIQTLTIEDANGQLINSAGSFACEMPYAFLRIPLTRSLQLNQEYVLRATFRGNLQTNMRGFYRSWYDDSTGRKWMGTTQFQPGHARQAFPCYDEPGFKATFDITINRESSFSETISNMPLRTSTPLPNGRIADSFYTTPKTSTYILAFIVSHYEKMTSNNDTSRPFAIYARNNAGSTVDWSLEVGEQLLAEMEEYTQYPYYSVAVNMDMKQAAIPDFSAGAMENWGLLTYREALVLYDPLNSNHFYKNRVPNIVSHEIAHMWFGNLVTCAWWDNLWLNEGFARFYQYFLTARVLPDMGYEIRFVTEQLHTSLLSDSVDSAHALTETNINTPTTVSNHFSTITYAKGASVLRMTQYLLGEDTYLKALRNYLQQRQFDVAEPHHLFQALDAAAVEDEALAVYNGITINEYFRTWSEQAGHPLLTVVVNQQTGAMTVTQARFNRDSGVSSISSLWQVPVTWTRGGNPDFDDLKPATVLTGQANVLQRNSTGLEWVLFNKQQSGFYRVNYDDKNWALITRALRGADRTIIHQLNRAQIVDDVFLFARSGILSYTKAFNILSFLEFEDDYAPWDAALVGFNFLIRRVAHDVSNLQKLQREIIKLSAAVTRRLRYSEVAGEQFMDGLQRMYINQLLCDVGHEQCVTSALINFQLWRNGGFIPANLRPWVYCTGLREGNALDFDYFWSRYLAEDLSSEKVVMLQVAGCTSNRASLEKFLDAIVSGDDAIRPQDFTTALNSAVSGNEFNAQRMFSWLQRNVEQTTNTLGSISTPLSYIAARLVSEQEINAFQIWVEGNRAMIGESAYNTGMNGAASTRANLQWSNRRMPELEQYFEVGYVEAELSENEEAVEEEEEEVQDETVEEIVEEIVESGTDSANVGALSFVTFLATVTISLLAQH